MADNTDILALLGDLLRATDRQTEANKQAIDELREEVRRTAQETNDRFEAMFNRFAIAVADGFIRSEKKLDAVKQEVAGVKQEVAGVKQEVANVKEEVAGVKQEVANVKEEVAGVKQEVAGVKQEVGALRQDVQRIDERLERIEDNQPALQDIVRRLTVVETIVLNRAS